MNVRTLLTAAALAVAASAPLAQETPRGTITLVPTGPTTFAATLPEQTPNGLFVNGLFVDTFELLPSTFAGSVSVSLMSVAGPVNFFAAILGEEGFSFLPETGQSTFAFQANVGGMAPRTLTVFGFSGDPGSSGEPGRPEMMPVAAEGAYRGTLSATSVAAIPEPETYALMLGGLAFVAAMRRRSTRRAQA